MESFGAQARPSHPVPDSGPEPGWGPEPGELLPVRFSGTAAGYFRIWLVNTLLTLVTIGVWSAWAKVRRRRYFYGSTEVADGRFDYLATAPALLTGRLLAVALLGGIALAHWVMPGLVPPLGLAALALVPWLVVRSATFNARMTRWRGLRFGFHGRFGGALVAHVLAPALSLATLGLATPLASWLAGRYWADNHTLGRARFACRPPLWSFVLAGLATLGLFVGLVLAFAAMVGGIAWGLGHPEILWPFAEPVPKAVVSTTVWPLIPLGVGVPAFLIAGAYYRARVRAIVLSSLVLEGGHRLVCRLAAGRVAWIVATNALATLATAGLAHPWGVVRLWRYHCACLAIRPGGPPESLIAAATPPAGSAFASEFADLDGFEVGL